MRKFPLRVLGALVATLLIGALDYATGDELDLFVLYFIPIAYAASTIDLRVSIGISGLATVLWFWANHLSARPYSNPLFAYWTAVVILTAFLCIAFGMHRLRTLLNKQSLLNAELATAMAKIKKLTGRLSICLGCKSIEDEGGQWLQPEEYFTAHSEDDFAFNLTVCPHCKVSKEVKEEPPREGTVVSTTESNRGSHE